MPPTSVPTFGQIVHLSLSRVWIPAILIALTLVIGIGLLIEFEVLPGDETIRPIMETASLGVLPAALLIALGRYAIGREAFFLWLTGFAGVLFCRELHFQGTSAGVYVGLGILAWLACRYYPQLGGYFANRRVATILTLILLMYFIGVTLDRNVWKFIPDRKIWASPLEEIVEIAGHIGVVILALAARPADNPLLKSEDEAGEVENG